MVQETGVSEIVKTGMLLAVLYECELTHYANADLQCLRKEVIKSEGLDMAGICRDYMWQLLGAKSDLEFIAGLRGKYWKGAKATCISAKHMCFPPVR